MNKKTINKNSQDKNNDFLFMKKTVYMHVKHRYLNYISNLNSNRVHKMKSFSWKNIIEFKDRVKCHQYNKKKNNSFNYTFLKPNQKRKETSFENSNTKSASEFKQKLFKKIEENIIDEGEKSIIN